MKKNMFFLCLILLLSLCISCNNTVQVDTEEPVETTEDYVVLENGDLQINIGNTRSVLEINALPDSQIIEDEDQRLLILSDPTDRYQHGILGDTLEASSVTIVNLIDQPTISHKFSVPKDWVIESILPIWSDWDEDGVREIVLTLSNSTSGAKLVLFDEDGNILAESNTIGIGFRWRHALDIAAFGENGERLLVDVITPHIGGIVSFYSWDKERKLLKTEATLQGYSTHDIGSRTMNMYTTIKSEKSEQVLLILPSQSKTELAGLRLVAGVIQEEWRIHLDGRLSGNLELVHENGVQMIRAIVDNQETLFEFLE